MATLYQLTGDLLILQQMIEDGAEGLEDTLQSIELAREEKLEGYAMIVRNFEGDVAALKSEEDRLKKRRQSYEKSIARMKQAIHDTLNTVEGKKVKTSKFTLYVQTNKPALVLDENLIPQEFKHTEKTIVIDKGAIEEKLKNGEEVEGAKFTQGESIRIR